jgi:hypothetical protein
LGVRLCFWSAFAVMVSSILNHVVRVMHWFNRPAITVPGGLLMVGGFLTLIGGLIVSLPRRDLPSPWMARARWVVRAVAWLMGVLLLAMVGLGLSGNFRMMQKFIVAYCVVCAALSLGSWLYWSVYFRGSRLRWVQWLLAVLTLFAAFGPDMAGSVQVQDSYYYSTTGLPAIGSIDALAIAVFSFLYKPRVDWPLVAYAVSGIAGLVVLVVFWIMGRTIRRAMKFGDLH